MKVTRKIYFVIGLGWLTASTIYAQINKDSLSLSDQWHSLKNNKISTDGKWNAITKLYKNNNDTICLVDTGNREKIDLAYTGYIEFVDNVIVCKSRDNVLKLINLTSKKTVTRDSISKINVLQNRKGIAYIKDNRNFYIEDIDVEARKTLFKASEVTDFYINKSESFAILISEKEEMKIYILDLETLTSNYVAKINNNIKKIIWNNSQNKALLQTLDNNFLLIDLIFSTAKYTILPESIGRVISVQFDFTEDDNVFFNPTVETNNWNNYIEYLDIWNGNDKNLEQKKYLKKGKVRLAKRLIYHPNTDKYEEIKTKDSQYAVFINSSKNMVFFDKNKNRDYTVSQPKTDIYLYDINNQKSELIVGAVENTTTNFSYSPDGEFIAFKKDGYWNVYDVNNKKSQQINIVNQNELFWFNHERAVYIVGDNNLWKVELTTNKAKNITNFKEKNLKIDIVNYRYIDRGINMLHVGVPKIIDEKVPLLLQIIDGKDNFNSVYSIDTKHRTKLLLKSENKISDLQWAKNLKTITFSEENYKLPKTIKKWKDGKVSLVLESHIPKDLFDWRRQKIITFKNKQGDVLKGLLYYPKNLNPNKKFPMVTHIYQIQNHLSNTFFTPKLTNPLGFNIPLLNELGYFVFLPDIVISDEGPGLAALDCVTRAIEAAVKEEPSININKLGLIGQSFGGYETNFIITQTNLFAAAVSGAATNDLVWDYYSYNYNFALPLFWRYEDSGQIEMRGSFKDHVEKFLRNSPILFGHQIQTPLLAWTGLEDYNVHWEHTRHFYTVLKRYKIPHIALFYRKEGHSMGTLETQKDLTIRIVDWLDYYLKDNKNIEWIKQGTIYSN